MTPKPHVRLIAGRLVLTDRQPRETPLEAARRRYGKPFGAVWATGEGPRFWTHHRVAQLAAANEEHRMRRKNLPTKGTQ